MEKKIIILEDEIIFATDLKRIVENYGYKVSRIFSSGEELLGNIANLEPDLIIMDIKLKGKYDGIETAKILKQDYDFPIIYLTAFSDKQTFDKAKITTPYGFLIKPFNPRELHSFIEIALYNHEIEKKIKESELLFNSILENIRESIVLFNKDRIIKFANRAFLNLAQYEESEVIGHSLESVVNLIDVMSHNKINIDNINTDDNYFECLLLTKKFDEIPVDLNINFIIDEKNNLFSHIVVFRDISENKKLEKEIHEAGENERRNIGNYLHDDIGQYLTGIAFLCKALQQKINSGIEVKLEETTKILDYVNEVTFKVKELSRGLIPVNIDPFNFYDLIQELCQNTENIFNVKCRLVSDKNFSIYDKLIATNLYYIVKEAVNNSVKHSESKNISIAFGIENDRINLVIEDDGKGMNANGNTTGLGLGIMNYRAKMIGARIKICDNGNQGTRIVCEFD
jgi:two-component system, LuxR family, sensor kinase FixL